MKITKKCHSHAAQPSGGIKRMRDEEQRMTKQTPHMKSPMHKQRRTEIEDVPYNSQKENYKREGGRGTRFKHILFQDIP